LGPCVVGPFEMWRKTRTLASSRRNRYTKEGFDLDLTYITPRILAMATPSQSIATWAFRNHIDEVQEFFKKKHTKGTVKLWNIMSEGRLDQATVQKLESVGVETIQDFSFDDRGVPPLELLDSAIASMQDWMHEQDAVCCVSCRSGKGRTGLVVSCLMLANHASSPEAGDDAMFLFSDKRVSEGIAMTVPSHRRWVRYFANRHQPLRRGLVGLSQVKFSIGAFGELPGQGTWMARQLQMLSGETRCKVLVFALVKQGDGKFDQKKVFGSKALKPDEEGNFTVDTKDKNGGPVMIQGAFRIMLNKHKDNGELLEGPSCWLHTNHIDEETVIEGSECDFPRASATSAIVGARGGDDEAGWGVSISVCPMGGKTGLPQV